jgi:hypothetical protein
MVNIEDLVPEGYACRKFMTLLDFDDIGNRLSKLKKNNPNEG